MATVWCMDLNRRESLDMARRFSSGFQPSLVIMVETLLVLLESLQTNLAALRCTASNLFLWSCLYMGPTPRRSIPRSHLFSQRYLSLMWLLIDYDITLDIRVVPFPHQLFKHWNVLLVLFQYPWALQPKWYMNLSWWQTDINNQWLVSVRILLVYICLTSILWFIIMRLAESTECTWLFDINIKIIYIKHQISVKGIDLKKCKEMMCKLYLYSIQGGPERMQHLRSMISRRRGTE